ncbi:MAG TPA: hypothetical protein VL523_09475 [Terriglobia bacterium]|nr:hypothetical protein [Terriglobia bacterium]
MPLKQFALFSDGEGGPLWREFFSSLDDAKRKGRECAETEAVEFFIFSFKEETEIMRFFPPPTKPQG